MSRAVTGYWICIATALVCLAFGLVSAAGPWLVGATIIWALKLDAES